MKRAVWVAIAAVGLGFCGISVGIGDELSRPSSPSVPVLETNTPTLPALPSPLKSSSSSAKSGGSRVVTPGAFCDSRGARGLTRVGTPMECKGQGPRWRRA